MQADDRFQILGGREASGSHEFHCFVEAGHRAVTSGQIVGLGNCKKRLDEAMVSDLVAREIAT